MWCDKDHILYIYVYQSGRRWTTIKRPTALAMANRLRSRASYLRALSPDQRTGHTLNIILYRALYASPRIYRHQPHRRRYIAFEYLALWLILFAYLWATVIAASRVCCVCIAHQGISRTRECAISWIILIGHINVCASTNARATHTHTHSEPKTLRRGLEGVLNNGLADDNDGRALASTTTSGDVRARYD